MAKAKRAPKRAMSALDETSGAPSAEDIASDEPGEHGDEGEQPIPAEPDKALKIDAAAVIARVQRQIEESRPQQPTAPPSDALIVAPHRGQLVIYHATAEVDDLAIVLMVYPDSACDLVTFHAPRCSAHGGAPQPSTFRGRSHPGKGVGEWAALPAGS